MTRRVPLLAAILLLAVNLRAALASFAPVADQARSALGLPAGVLSLATALPVITFALVAIPLPGLARRYGQERVLTVAMGLLALGIGVRSAGGLLTLLAGTVLLGMGIAAGNVLLPGLIKRAYPGRVGVVTGLYATAMAVAATVAAGATRPAERLFGGWRVALDWWALPALLAALVWLGRVAARREADAVSVAVPAERAPSPWRDGLAWAVALFFTTQSALFYITLAWLPSIYADAGVDRTTAGLLMSLAQLVGVPLAFVVPAVAGRSRQWPLVLACVLCYLAAVLGLLVAPAGVPYLWAVLLGFGGVGFPLVLTMIPLRSRGPAAADRLSGMTQSFGYPLAALGPVIAGTLHDVTGSWRASLLMMLALVVLMLPAGLVAARRERMVGPALLLGPDRNPTASRSSTLS